MSHPNLELIDRFFAAYGGRNRASLQAVLAEQATWTFPGHHPLSGTKIGIDAKSRHQILARIRFPLPLPGRT